VINSKTTFRTPILFIIYNRPDTTKRVFERIAEIKPDILYIAADGPKESLQDARKTEITRSLVLEGINWNCKINTLLRSENLGCRKSVSGAINWFFENEEKGIIIEDDTLPATSFFQFADEMLTRFQKDRRILSISGFNFGINSTHIYKSKFFNMWCWASWRDRANMVDYEMSEWKKLSLYKKKKLLFKVLKEKNKIDIGWVNYWLNVFNKLSSGRIDTWDYQWLYLSFKQSLFSIVSPSNLVENIGFGHSNATHTVDGDEFYNNLKAVDISGLIDYDPDSLNYNKEYEEILRTEWCKYKQSKVVKSWVAWLILQRNYFFNILIEFLKYNEKMIKRGVHWFLKVLGYRLVTTKRKNEKASNIVLKNNNSWLSSFKFKSIVDIGANIGDFTLEINSFLPNAKIICFEPIVDCYNVLQSRVKGANNIVLYNFALGEKNGSEIINRSSYTPSSSLLKMADLHKSEFKFTSLSSKETITVKRLDDVEGIDEIVPPILIKIDVQGYEAFVIKGGLETIKRAKVVLCEMSFTKLYEGQSYFDDIYKTLLSIGFKYQGSYDQLVSPTNGLPLQCDGIFINPNV
jgi:FkbM family methyltransferase